MNPLFCYVLMMNQVSYLTIIFTIFTLPSLYWRFTMFTPF